MKLYDLTCDIGNLFARPFRHSVIGERMMFKQIDSIFIHIVLLPLLLSVIPVFEYLFMFCTNRYCIMFDSLFVM